MTDWRAWVRQHLSLPGIEPLRKTEIVEDIARQLEEAHAEALRAGLDPDAAVARAKNHVEDWDVLSADLARMARGHREAKVDRWLDGARHDLVRRWGPWRFAAALRRDVLYGLRLVMRRPAFASLVVVTLALGIGANTAIYSVVQGVLLRPLPFPD